MSDVLIIPFAICIGLAIGFARGGRGQALDSITIKAKSLLVIGVAATLISSVLNPSQPMLWATMAAVSLAVFAAANLNRTGMTVLLIGLLCNLASLVANGSIPVSERALLSIDRTDDAGMALVEDPFVATSNDTRLAPLSKVIPVPGFGLVLSIGDLIVLVALADISMHLLVSAPARERRRQESSEDGFFTADSVDANKLVSASHALDSDEVTIDLTNNDGPAHAAPPTRVPRIHRPRRRTGRRGVHAATPDAPAQKFEPKPPEPVIDLTDSRPIIDLTTSPTEQQLAEFFRRREAADRRISRHSQQQKQHRPTHATKTSTQQPQEANLLSEILY